MSADLGGWLGSLDSGNTPKPSNASRSILKRRGGWGRRRMTETRRMRAAEAA